MASDIFNVEPPRWLQAIAQPIDTKLTGQVLGAALAGATGAAARGHEQVQTGTDAEGKPIYGERGGSWFGNFLGAAAEAKMSMADPLWRLKANEMQVQTLKDMVGLASADIALKQNRQHLANTTADMQHTSWFSLTPEARSKTPMPAFLTPEYLNRGIQQLNADSEWMNRQANSFIAKDYAAIRTNLLASGDAGVAALAALPPVQGPAPTERDLAAIKAAQSSVIMTNQLRDMDRENRAIAAGMQPSFKRDITPTSSVTYVPRTAGSATGAATTWRQRFLRAQEIDAEAVKPWADILTEPDPASMAEFVKVETPLLAGAQSRLAAKAAIPGASGTYNRTGITSATIQTPQQAGPMPEPVPVYLSGSNTPDYWQIAVPVIQGKQITSWRVENVKTSTEQQYTANTYLTAAKLVDDQLFAAEMHDSGMSATEKKTLQDDKRKYTETAQAILDLDISRRAGATSTNAPITNYNPIRTPITYPPAPPAGTNAPARGTNTSGPRNYRVLPDGSVVEE